MSETVAGPGCARPEIHLTMAINDSDQVRDLVSGKVPTPGIKLTCIQPEVEEIFFRFTRHREWGVSELSLGKYCALRSRGDESLTAIPVFPSRSFRHSAFYVRPDGPVDDPGALAGARIGFPEWTVTATVYARALLTHEYGIDLAAIDWVQGGTNEPGRVETLPVDLPDGVTVTPVADRSLDELLRAGELDAVIAPHPPRGFSDGSGRVVRLFSDHQREEERYFRRTGVFPIMHVVAIRADVYQAHPWIAGNLLEAFTRAKDRSVERMLDANAPRSPVPWGPAHAARALSVIGDDPWPYGLDANRKTLSAFLTFATEQNVCAPGLEPEDLFAPEVLEAFKI